MKKSDTSESEHELQSPTKPKTFAEITKSGVNFAKKAVAKIGGKKGIKTPTKSPGTPRSDTSSPIPDFQHVSHQKIDHFDEDSAEHLVITRDTYDFLVELNPDGIRPFTKNTPLPEEGGSIQVIKATQVIDNRGLENSEGSPSNTGNRPKNSCAPIEIDGITKHKVCRTAAGICIDRPKTSSFKSTVIATDDKSDCNELNKTESTEVYNNREKLDPISEKAESNPASENKPLLSTKNICNKSQNFTEAITNADPIVKPRLLLKQQLLLPGPGTLDRSSSTKQIFSDKISINEEILTPEPLPENTEPKKRKITEKSASCPANFAPKVPDSPKTHVDGSKTMVDVLDFDPFEFEDQRMKLIKKNKEEYERELAERRAKNQQDLWKIEKTTTTWTGQVESLEDELEKSREAARAKRQAQREKEEEMQKETLTRRFTTDGNEKSNQQYSLGRPVIISSDSEEDDFNTDTFLVPSINKSGIEIAKELKTAVTSGESKDLRIIPEVVEANDDASVCETASIHEPLQPSPSPIRRRRNTSSISEEKPDIAKESI